MTHFVKSHWDIVIGALATITVAQLNLWIALLIGVATLVLLVFKLCVWALKVRITWRNRNNTEFFERLKDEDLSA